MIKQLLILGLLTSPAFAEPTAPQWEEFCPAEFLEAQKGPEPKLPLTVFGLKKYDAALEVNHWASRRPMFENEVALCQQATSDTAMCYMQIRQMETFKNQAHQTEIDNRRLRRAVRGK